MKNNKMWALLINLGTWYGVWNGTNGELKFDEEVWEYIIEEAPKAGIDTIVICIGGGIDFASHPEISLKGAWSRERLKSEIARLSQKGIRVIPKLNFATTHSVWLSEYSRMISSSVYYKVAKDLIEEAYELFEHPEYIHLGMDEEDEKHVRKKEYAVYRQGSLYWHDLRYLIDCVAATGAKPWIWSCPLFDHPDEFEKHIGKDEIVLSPWYYNAFRKEHWTPVESRAEYVAYYNEGEYAQMGIKFVEEDPFLVNVRRLAIPLLANGYHYIPCASVYNRCDYNTSDLVEYFRDNSPDEQIDGYITAPWVNVVPEYRHFFEESFKFLKEAKEKFYS